LVNSVYYGLTTPVNSIEEAVFYLGVRQIRQLAMVTPVIEDFQKLAGNAIFPWREFWQHCIGTAIMTREVVTVAMVPSDEADYVAGLVHDVGKIVMASAFPTQFAEVHRRIASGAADLLVTENEVLGLDHAELGAIYLHNHNLPEVMVDVARYHHRSTEAKQNAPLAAAVQIADMLVRYAKIGTSGNPESVSEEDPYASKAWQLIFTNQDEEENANARAALKRSLDRLPTILDGLV
jgi:putative nucleotidyltransferase with HDIG domain